MTSYTFTSLGAPPGYDKDRSIIEIGKSNNNGDFVGGALKLAPGSVSESFSGFTYENGSYKIVNYPDSKYTTLGGINDRGQVVGSYGSAQTDSRLRAFIYEGSTYKNLEIPNSRASYGNDINNDGVVTGYYTDSNNIDHGYIYNSGSYTTIDGPGATSTYLSGLNDRGVAVGGYNLGTSAAVGLVYENGTRQTLSYPGAATTSLIDINNDGTIIGRAYLGQTSNTPAATIGFTYKDGVFDQIDGTQIVAGINDRGQLLAQARDGSSLISSPLCFVTGTLIRTMRGEVPVEELRVSDRAVTVTGERRSIRWSGRRTLDCPRNLRPSAVCPVRVRTDAFGPGLPARDLRLSPGHPILVGADAGGRGGVLVPIMCLINGTTILREPAPSVTYWHVELDVHDILLAEGLPAESYYDMGGRAWFAGDNRALVDPDFVPVGENGRCRPVVVDGPQVEAERLRLSALFAAALGAQCAWDEAGRIDWTAA